MVMVNPFIMTTFSTMTMMMLQLLMTLPFNIMIHVIVIIHGIMNMIMLKLGSRLGLELFGLL